MNRRLYILVSFFYDGSSAPRVLLPYFWTPQHTKVFQDPKIVTNKLIIGLGCIGIRLIGRLAKIWPPLWCEPYNLLLSSSMFFRIISKSRRRLQNWNWRTPIGLLRCLMLLYTCCTVTCACSLVLQCRHLPMPPRTMRIVPAWSDHSESQNKAGHQRNSPLQLLWAMSYFSVFCISQNRTWYLRVFASLYIKLYRAGHDSYEFLLVYISNFNHKSSMFACNYAFYHGAVSNSIQIYHWCTLAYSKHAHYCFIFIMI